MQPSAVGTGAYRIGASGRYTCEFSNTTLKEVRWINNTFLSLCSRLFLTYNAEKYVFFRKTTDMQYVQNLTVRRNRRRSKLST